MTNIEEQRFIRVGGIDQWIQIRGGNRDNPVLLVLHGGPGSPYALFTPLLREWEEHFTVVQWDRRGAGKTLGRNGREGCGEMSFERCAQDAVEVVEFLRGHLDKDKVVLLAGSMGTMIGTPLVQRRPDLFEAYVATDLYVDMVDNEAESYRLALLKNPKAAKALAAIGPDPTAWDHKAWEVKMRWSMDNAVLGKLFMPLVLKREVYGWRDLRHVLAGFGYSKKALFDDFMGFSAEPDFEVPVVFLQGADDEVTVRSLAEAYFARVTAPSKRMALIPDAGHFAAFTRPDRFLAELLGAVERP
ncbi:alpha/beta hydrolase [Umezawaea sp. Da 62-37]|uniref:alpha/beta fold hydrolase n=1 Tax=Umezawaea sp. Da 62-37 TaxID=3075927 RepID=UPI0028F6F2BD|nr:alpha/beta hydrolase [Umezawaea sp. Da 62-37]WNV91475.1 alpha/beta hydrolase [Umezawaea sp. Da 62-37]